MQTPTIKRYQKQDSFTYTSGAFPTMELLSARPESARAVFLHTDCRDSAALEARCAAAGVPVIPGERAFSRTGRKENTYVLGLLEKYACFLSPRLPHIVLVNPGDQGNLGTIVRTAAGMGYRDLAVITPAADIWHPKVLRASMGALFHMRFQHFSSFEQYRAVHCTHQLFPFLLDGRARPEDASLSPGPFSLIFGNEAAGLDEAFHQVGQSLQIPQSPVVDSLNLAVAVGVGAYLFAVRRGLLSTGPTV